MYKTIVPNLYKYPETHLVTEVMVAVKWLASRIIISWLTQCILSLPPEISENLTVFWCFQGVEKGWIRNEWVKWCKMGVRWVKWDKIVFLGSNQKCMKNKFPENSKLLEAMKQACNFWTFAHHLFCQLEQHLRCSFCPGISSSTQIAHGGKF